MWYDFQRTELSYRTQAWVNIYALVDWMITEGVTIVGKPISNKVGFNGLSKDRYDTSSVILYVVHVVCDYV